MKLTKEQLSTLFSKYLEEEILPLVVNPEPIFLTEKGGEVLAHRLFLCLKGPKWYYLVKDDIVDCDRLLRRVVPALQSRGVEIMGLNYVVTRYDIKRLIKLSEKTFNDEYLVDYDGLF